MYKKEREKMETNRNVTFDPATLKEKSPLDIARLFFAMKGLEMSASKEQKIEDSTIKAEQNKKA